MKLEKGKYYKCLESIFDNSLPTYRFKKVNVYYCSKEGCLESEYGSIVVSRIYVNSFKNVKESTVSVNIKSGNNNTISYEYVIVPNKGKKETYNKLPLDRVITKQFPKALKAISKCSKFGHDKYKDYDDDWLNYKRVDDGIQKYADALQRHNLNKDQKDKESGFPHIYHKAWNALAELELWIE